MAKYVTQNLEEDVTCCGQTWTGYHAQAIHNLLKSSPRTMLIVSGRDRVTRVTLDLIHAGVVRSFLTGTAQTVIKKHYELTAQALKELN